MKKKTIILLSILGMLFLSLMTIAQGMRWYRLSTPKIELITAEGEYLDVMRLKNMDLKGIKNKAFDKKSLAGLDEGWQYFFSYSIQKVYKRGTFPFAKVKSDTLSVTLDKHLE